MRTELRRWEEAGNVTDNRRRDGHYWFTKPVICWCLYHVNKSHREWAMGKTSMTAEEVLPFKNEDWQQVMAGPASKTRHFILHIRTHVS